MRPRFLPDDFPELEIYELLGWDLPGRRADRRAHQLHRRLRKQTRGVGSRGGA